MRYPYSNIYEQFVQQSPVPLRPRLSSQAFSRNGDQFIMVCDPMFPTMGTCQYFQSMANLNHMQRKHLIEQAKKLGLAMIPAINIDLAKRFKKAYEGQIRTRFFDINLKASLTGNAKIIYRTNQSNLWLHTGKDKYRGSLQVFKKVMSGNWHISVNVTTKLGVTLTMKHTDGLWGSIQFQGPLRRNKKGDGLVAILSLVDFNNKRMVKMGPLYVGGNFGFKVEVTGEWKKWELNDYFLPEDYKEYIDLLGVNEEYNSMAHVQHTHIVIPYKAEVVAGLASTIAIISKWYMNMRPVIGNMEALVESLPPIPA